MASVPLRTLTQGAVVALSNAAERLTFGVGWRSEDPDYPVDFDLSALLLDGKGGLIDAVYHRCLTAKGGGVRLMGDLRGAEVEKGGESAEAQCAFRGRKGGDESVGTLGKTGEGTGWGGRRAQLACGPPLLS